MCAESHCTPDGYTCKNGLMTICQGGFKEELPCAVLCQMDHFAGFKECGTNADIGQDTCVCLQTLEEDPCATDGRYGNGVCNLECPLPDKDCGDYCETLFFYGDGECQSWCPNPDPDC